MKEGREQEISAHYIENKQIKKDKKKIKMKKEARKREIRATITESVSKNLLGSSRRTTRNNITPQSSHVAEGGTGERGCIENSSSWSIGVTCECIKNK